MGELVYLNPNTQQLLSVAILKKHPVDDQVKEPDWAKKRFLINISYHEQNNFCKYYL